jgi:carbon-monoxide dehydrogenase medium subunit
VKPPPFKYIAAKTLVEALAAKAEHGAEARFLAGGQSLIPALNFRLASPAVLIDINLVTELDYVREDGALRIGALTRIRTLERSPLVGARQPLVAEALPHVAHPQIRNRGTLGGNLAHADPASELPAVMLALGARMRVKSARGERSIDAKSFFTGALTTALREDEMLTEIELPSMPLRSGTSFPSSPAGAATTP